jgi:hypothetical protein
MVFEFTNMLGSRCAESSYEGQVLGKRLVLLPRFLDVVSEGDEARKRVKEVQAEREEIFTLN